MFTKYRQSIYHIGTLSFSCHKVTNNFWDFLIIFLKSLQLHHNSPWATIDLNKIWTKKPFQADPLWFLKDFDRRDPFRQIFYNSLHLWSELLTSVAAIRLKVKFTDNYQIYKKETTCSERHVRKQKVILRTGCSSYKDKSIRLVNFSRWLTNSSANSDYRNILLRPATQAKIHMHICTIWWIALWVHSELDNMYLPDGH